MAGVISTTRQLLLPACTVMVLPSADQLLTLVPTRRLRYCTFVDYNFIQEANELYPWTKQYIFYFFNE